MKKIISVLLCMTIIISLLLTFSGCDTTTKTVKPINLMADIKAGPNDTAYLASFGDEENTEYQAFQDFSVEIFKNQNGDGNYLISPISIICALSMVANGADGETLKEFEDTFGLSVASLNEYLRYLNDCIIGDSESLKLANSIWFANREDFVVYENFLQTNADNHKAEIYSAPFNKNTVEEINSWVKTNTNKMIPSIIDELPDESVMCLVNALAFEAEWAEVYNEDQVHDNYFYSNDGGSHNVEFMYNDEYKYLQDENSTGFIKYYSGEKYAFVAILPNEDVKIDDYIASMSGKKIANLLANVQEEKVKTSIPKFEYNYSAKLNETLIDMGIKDAFDENEADFSNLGELANKNIFIDTVIHKTYIQVAEQGTRAGAATAVIVSGSSMPQKELKVYLNRPFVYMIVDCEYNTPFFMGCVKDLGEQ